MANRTTSPLVRFRKMVRVDVGGCHLWLGRPNKHGYGSFWNGEHTELAHRFAYRVANSIVASMRADQKILHSCDNPACVNPAHLRLGTMKQNSHDMKSRGRRVSRQKLTDDQIKEMAWFFELGRHSFESVGKIFGVHKNVAYQIKHRKLEYASRILGPVLV